MDPARWKTIEDVFNQAVEMPEASRAEFLNRVCDGDSGIRSEVESLIARADRDGQRLHSLVNDAVVQALASGTSLVGQTIRHYSVTALIGSGGMGEVYRAHDTKLKRDVAIKVLPAHLAADPERISRFKRESELLATLNHPNIAAIYGVEEAGITRCLILELVDGETLQERLQRGPIRVQETLELARQIAEALEAAHQKGIVHRDLKPANIKVTSGGKAKVLDFGLARIFEPKLAAKELSDSPTISQQGLLIGTLPYMSPEQARGESADRAADIWAFGAVLFEMLSRKQAFSGQTRTDILASVVKTDPDWNALPDDTPSTIRTLLRRCLEKNGNRRIHDIADARLEIEDALTSPSLSPTAPVRHTSRTHQLAWIIAGALALASMVLMLSYRFWRSPEPRVIRLEIALPPETRTTGRAVEPNPAVSPDGRYLAFTAIPRGSTSLTVFVRALDSLTAEPVPGTEDIIGSPFWSPDDRFIGFITGGAKLKKVALSGGSPQSLCDASGGGVSGTWSKNNVILFEKNHGLFQVDANGGDPSVVLSPSPREGWYASPSFLPDGEHFLFSATDSETGGPEVRIGSLSQRRSTRLLAQAGRSAYANGQLLFVRDGALMTQPFDAVKLKLTGEMFALTQSVFDMTTNSHLAPFSVSENGTLIYRSDKMSHMMVWFDRSGNRVAAETLEGYHEGNSLSPDETRLAYARRDSSGISNIYVRDLQRGTDTALTSTSGENLDPVWSPDGDKIAFASVRSGKWELYQKSKDGTGIDEPLHVQAASPNQWSRAGILFATDTIPIHTSFLSSTDGKQYPLLTGNERHARFSPDNKFIVYTHFEPDRADVFVQPFPQTGERWPISVNGGFYPTWRPDGKEIFFMSSGSIMAAAVTLEPKFKADIPRKLFTMTGGVGRFPVTKDGRFLFILPKEENLRPTLTVVLNWTAGLKK
jgi:serine/threonine protein kinase